MSATHTVAPEGAKADAKVENDWTIMVFFAGEQDLSPSMTSQLKAIKDAGFQKNTTVLIHYDPNKRGVGTVTFDINQEGKRKVGTSIGDGRNPFVRNLFDDVIPGAPKGASASQALKMFLEMGEQHYPAKHYAIILVGHGVIVGNDAFLPDSSPEITAITLKDLGEILSGFQATAKWHESTVELIGLHSCSMSAIEVVYQLQGAAKYLLATEGVSFVGSWPYRQILKKILNTIDEAKQYKKKVDVDDLVMSVQRLCLHNSTDFMFSGLSADLCLCSLDPEKIRELDDPLRNLTRTLKEALKDPRGQELIQLAHLKSQSYFEEMYTDLYDFCLCLEDKCLEHDALQAKIKAACKAVRERLKETNKPGGLIVFSDFFGPLYQYSHGLSVYFPWARPVQDVPVVPADDILGHYENYEFTKQLGKDDSWLSFLSAYFAATMRKSRAEEDKPAEHKQPKLVENGQKTLPAVPVVVGSAGVSIADGLAKSSPELAKISPELQKSSPELSGGCGCTIKNYPMQFIQSQRPAENGKQPRNGSEQWQAHVEAPAPQYKE